MKISLFVFIMFICNISNAQKNHFIRIYSNQKHKIAKGYLQKVSDSSIFLIQRRKNHVVEVHYYTIGYVKLRRSVGHTLAMVTLINAGIGGVIGAATSHNSSNSDFFFSNHNAIAGFAIGSTLSAIGGVMLGTVIGGTKGIVTPKIIPVKSNLNNWQTASKQLNDWLKK